MRMHTAVKLNAAIQERSGEAELVIINFPAPPATLSAEENCILLPSGVKLNSQTAEVWNFIKLKFYGNLNIKDNIKYFYYQI